MKEHQKIEKIAIFFREDNEPSKIWNKKIREWLKEKHPDVKIVPLIKKPTTCGNAPDVILVFGGDGTIIEVAEEYASCNALIMGLNLGHVGFMASVRDEKDFMDGIEKLFQGKYRVDSRMKIKATLIRAGKNIAELEAINEIAIQHLFGIVHLDVEIEKHPFQYIRGSGVLISTASGSTAYNLSAHGPIAMPEIKCFIITELQDHNLPTPSVIIKDDSEITVTVSDFRKNDKFIIAKNKKKADVILAADGGEVIPLQKGDQIILKRSDELVNFVEIEKNYFFKSLQEKFAFK